MLQTKKYSVLHIKYLLMFLLDSFIEMCLESALFLVMWANTNIFLQIETVGSINVYLFVLTLAQNKIYNDQSNKSEN